MPKGKLSAAAAKAWVWKPGLTSALFRAILRCTALYPKTWKGARAFFRKWLPNALAIWVSFTRDLRTILRLAAPFLTKLFRLTLAQDDRHQRWDEFVPATRGGKPNYE